MAYFNYTNFCSNSTSGEYDGCLSQASVPDQVDVYAPETSTNGWVEYDQRYNDDVARWPTSLRPEANLGKRDCSTLKGRGLTYISPGSTSYETQTQGYDQWVYPEHYRSATHQDAQPNYETQQGAQPTYTTQQYARSDYATQQYAWPNYTTQNYDASANTATLEASELLPAPSNSEPSQPRIDWEDNQSGHITDVPYVVGGRTLSLLNNPTDRPP